MKRRRGKATGADAKKRPPTPEEWAAAEVAKSRKASEEQIRRLCQIYGPDLHLSA